MTSPRSARARAIVGSLVVLALMAGAAAGVAGGRFLAPRLTIRATMDMTPVLDELDLTADQRRRADSILARSAPRSRAIMLELADRLAAVADSVDGELRAILSAEQRARLDAMRSDRRMLMKRKVVAPGGTRVDTLVDTSLRRR